ncbi:hypothetical protein ACWCP6_09870 [Streptomyces sp. NPDC002004]
MTPAVPEGDRHRSGILRGLQRDGHRIPPRGRLPAHGGRRPGRHTGCRADATHPEHG